jgi:hypothetical protein
VNGGFERRLSKLGLLTRLHLNETLWTEVEASSSMYRCRRLVHIGLSLLHQERVAAFTSIQFH